MKEIRLFDAPTGSGKTTAMFKWMLGNPERRYLYVSPMLSEVEDRVVNELSALSFVYPSPYYDVETQSSGKSYSLLKYLEAGRNITFTHSLFKSLSDEHMSVIESMGYTLVIDEEVEFITQYRDNYVDADIITLFKNKWISVDEEDFGRVVWVNEKILPESKYYEFKRMCDSSLLYNVGDRVMVVSLPMSLLISAKEVFLLTYKFDGSIMKPFISMRGIRWVDIKEVYSEISTTVNEKEWKERIKTLLTIGENKNTKEIKNRKWSLSHGWYTNNATKEQLEFVGKTIRNICVKHGQENVLYTMPKSSSERQIGGRYNNRCALNRRTKNGEGYYLYPGARATNIYSYKTAMIHAYNRHPNLAVDIYLRKYGEGVDKDEWALSEMIQWIWRGCIRNNQPMTIYFLSDRMEEIFTKWLYNK